MICPKCNKDAKKAKFCPACGENLEQFVKNKKDQRKNKILKIKMKIAIFLFALLIILIVFVVVQNIYFSKNNSKYTANTQNVATIQPENVVDKISQDDYIIETTDYSFELTEENKTEDADEDGLTNEEEAAAGTLPTYEDSDGDGLTDYEELKRHNTNPLKVSTSDDNISDYVKVEKDLDVNKKYSENEITIENKKINSKITLVPSNLESEVLGEFASFSRDNTVNSLVNKFTVYNFEGKIEYKLEKVDVILLEYSNEKYTEFDDYSMKADVMTINIDKEDNSKVFVIVEKENYENYLNQDKGGEN